MNHVAHDGYCWALRAVDCNTTWAVTIPQKEKTASTTGKNMANIWAMQGCPAILQSDNGTEFFGECQRIAEEWSPGTIKIIRGRWVFDNMLFETNLICCCNQFCVAIAPQTPASPVTREVRAIAQVLQGSACQSDARREH
jgi:hypothetical protein